MTGVFTKVIGVKYRMDNVISKLFIYEYMGNVPTVTETIPHEFLSGAEYVTKKQDGTSYKNGANKILNSSNELRSFLMGVRMRSNPRSNRIVAIAEREGLGIWQYWLWDIETQDGVKLTLPMCKPYP